MSLGIIVFSRMNSSRLQGKAMLDFGGKPLVEHVIRRAQQTGYKVVLATTDTPEDDVLEKHAVSMEVDCFRGSEANVLERAVLAAEHFGFKAFARLCGDRPFFSVDELQQGLKIWHNTPESQSPDLITNTYPTKALGGMTMEVIKTSRLGEQLDHKPTAEQQEHITMGFYKAPEQYHIISLNPKHKKTPNHPGFAVDTAEDYKRLLKTLKKVDI